MRGVLFSPGQMPGAALFLLMVLSASCLRPPRGTSGCASSDEDPAHNGTSLGALSAERLEALRIAVGSNSALVSTSFHTAAVSEPDSGRVRVFVDYEGAWKEEATLSPASPAKGFGASISLWGNTVLVGAPEAGVSGTGLVYVFYRDQEGFREQAILSPASGALGQTFGSSVSVAGDAAFVGASGSAMGYVFSRKNRVWVEETKGPLSDASIEAKRASIEALRIGDCASSTTLNALVTCIREQMPRSGSNGFVKPTLTEQTEFRDAVRQMAQGQCNFALGASIAGPMRIRTFHDSQDGHDYCLLMEVEDANNNGYVDRGWGTYIVNAAATRQVVHVAAHPLYDTGTELEAIDIFKATESRHFLLCGAHRLANSTASACQADYKESDCAHSMQNMFFPAIQEIEAVYAGARHVALQWHGMSTSNCSGVHVYLGEGLLTAPVSVSRLPELRDNLILAHPTWNVDMTGDGTCTLNGTESLQGRLLNGVPLASLCTTSASASMGMFVQIEQQPSYRAAADWTTPVNNTFPTVVSSPPLGVAAEPGFQAIRISWTAPPGTLEGYDVFRSETAGGPYAVIAEDVPQTSYIDTGLPLGSPRFYVVQAANFAGNSVNSAEVMASAVGVLAPPTGLSATPAKKAITLRWMAAIGANSYKVERGTKSGGPYAVVNPSVTGTSYTNTGLTSGRTYYYVLTSINGSTESVRSTQVSATAN